MTILNKQEKKVAVSFTLGISSLIGGILTIFIYIVGLPFGWSEEIFLKIYFIVPILGLIFGMIELKSIKKKMAIIGIILSLIGLIGTLFLSALIYSIASGM